MARPFPPPPISGRANKKELYVAPLRIGSIWTVSLEIQLTRFRIGNSSDNKLSGSDHILETGSDPMTRIRKPAFVTNIMIAAPLSFSVDFSHKRI